jgi:hypothetical protein
VLCNLKSESEDGPSALAAPCNAKSEWRKPKWHLNEGRRQRAKSGGRLLASTLSFFGIN